MSMHYIDSNKMFAVGEVFPPQAHYDRVQRYRVNKKLFEGYHADVFKENTLGSNRVKDILYVSVNLAGIICKKSADFLYGEELKITAGKEDHKAQEALDRFYEDNHLNILLYESALSNAYSGDAFIKVRYGQEYAGELPPELDAPKVLIEALSPANVFPDTVTWDKSKIKVYHVTNVHYCNDKKLWYLNVESHVAGAIYYHSYTVTPLYHDLDMTPIRFSIDGVVEDSFKVVYTGVKAPLVIHIPNLSTSEDWAGLDDLTELHPLFDEINNRISQIADILDKHSNPALAVPSGLLSEDEDGNASFNVSYSKVFEVLGKEDILPEYITWDGQLSNAFSELDRLIDLVLTTAEIPAVAIGRGDAGTSGSSGLAIKWRMNSLLAKINRKRQYYSKGIKQILRVAQELENVVGVANYEPVIPVLHFSDGLPKDDLEQATIANMRTGGLPTLSQKSAIMQLNGLTEEQAELEISRINEERNESEASPSIFDVYEE